MRRGIRRASHANLSKCPDFTSKTLSSCRCQLLSPSGATSSDASGPSSGPKKLTFCTATQDDRNTGSEAGTSPPHARGLGITGAAKGTVKAEVRKAAAFPARWLAKSKQPRRPTCFLWGRAASRQSGGHRRCHRTRCAEDVLLQGLRTLIDLPLLEPAL
jgi:hypothetical protein